MELILLDLDNMFVLGGICLTQFLRTCWPDEMFEAK